MVLLGSWGANRKEGKSGGKEPCSEGRKGREDLEPGAVEENGEMSAATFQGYTPSALSFPRIHSASVHGNHYPSSTE